VQREYLVLIALAIISFDLETVVLWWYRKSTSVFCSFMLLYMYLETVFCDFGNLFTVSTEHLYILLKKAQYY